MMIRMPTIMAQSTRRSLQRPAWPSTSPRASKKKTTLRAARPPVQSRRLALTWAPAKVLDARKARIGMVQSLPEVAPRRDGDGHPTRRAETHPCNAGCSAATRRLAAFSEAGRPRAAAAPARRSHALSADRVLLAAARAEPGRLRVGTVGKGTLGDLVLDLLRR